MTTTGTAPYYSWPLVEGLSWEPQSVIIRVLDEPEERRIPTNKRSVSNLSCRMLPLFAQVLIIMMHCSLFL